MRYVLDTNIVSYSIDRRSPFHPKVITRLSRLAETDIVCISVLTVYEAEYGVLAVTPEHHARVRQARDLMLRLFTVLPVSVAGAQAFGRMRAAYRQKTGMPQKLLDQHNIDFILASSALAENAVLVSNDKIFAALRAIEPRLQLENWAA